MRLKDWETKGIIKVIEDFFLDNNLLLNQVALYLYGSRTDDKKRGGDIDLLLHVPSPIIIQVKECKSQIHTKIKDVIGDQKIDILIVDKNSAKEPFSSIALKNAVLIKSW